MPSVVRMAITEQAIISPFITRSVAWRARKFGADAGAGDKRPTSAIENAATTIA